MMHMGRETRRFIYDMRKKLLNYPHVLRLTRVLKISGNNTDAEVKNSNTKVIGFHYAAFYNKRRFGVWIGISDAFDFMARVIECEVGP